MKRLALALLFSVLGARLAAAAETSLPKWPTTEESWGAWYEITFQDAEGKAHDVWCHYKECGGQKTSGTANLYVLKQAGQEPFEVSDGSLWWKKKWTAYKTTFGTELSDYKLKLGGGYGTIVLPGTKFERRMTRGNYMDQLTATGSVMIVLAPMKAANDGPKAVAEKPAPKKPKTPAPVAKKPALEPKPEPEAPKEEPKPEVIAPPVVVTAPATQEPLSLSDDERKLLTKEDDDAYVKEIAGVSDEAKRKEIVSRYRQIIKDTNLDPETLAKLSPENAAKYKAELAAAKTREDRMKIVSNYRLASAKDQARDSTTNPDGNFDGNTRKPGAGEDKGAVKGSYGKKTAEEIAAELGGGKQPEQGLITTEPPLAKIGKDAAAKADEKKKDENPWRDYVAGGKMAVVTGLIGFFVGGPVGMFLFGVVGFIGGAVISAYGAR